MALTVMLQDIAGLALKTLGVSFGDNVIGGSNNKVLWGKLVVSGTLVLKDFLGEFFCRPAAVPVVPLPTSTAQWPKQGFEVWQRE